MSAAASTPAHAPLSPSTLEVVKTLREAQRSTTEQLQQARGVQEDFLAFAKGARQEQARQQPPPPYLPPYSRDPSTAKRFYGHTYPSKP